MNIDLSSIVSNAVTLPTTQQGGAQLLNSVNKIVYAVALICFALLVASLVAVYKLYRLNKVHDLEIKDLKSSIEKLSAKTATVAPEQTMKFRPQIVPLVNTEPTEEEKAAAALKKEKHLEQSKEAEGLIMDLFGGQEKFEELPELDGKDKTDTYIKVTLDELTAPIMRGRDSSGRLFLSIRAKSSDGEMCRQIFFSRYPDSGYWLSSGDTMLSTPLIECGENYTSQKNPVYENLKNFVQTKKLEVDQGALGKTITYEIC